MVPILSASNTRHGSNINYQSGNPRHRPYRGFNVPADTRPHSYRMNAELSDQNNPSFCLRLHRKPIGNGGEFSLYGLADQPVLANARLLPQTMRLFILRGLVDIKLHQLDGGFLDYSEDLL